MASYSEYGGQETDDGVSYLHYMAIHGSEYDRDSDSLEIDYPDADEVYWSDSDEETYHRRNNQTPRFDHRLLHCLLLGDRFKTEMRSHQGPCKPRKVVGPKITTKAVECPICLEPCGEEVKTAHLYCSSECGNIFHRKCMEQYASNLHTPVKCPLCRTLSEFKQLVP